ncbi:putative receptor-like protein kinase [Forsythia ovata]|uniref:Receptor-like protein kinase n=1 Tax=Forsythia ovata TaxID=205694 RepID=A0ABD1SJ29_9LAMI
MDSGFHAQLTYLAIFLILVLTSVALSAGLEAPDIAAILAVFAVIVLRFRFNTRTRQLERQFDSEGRELRIEYSFLRKVAGVPTKFRYRELEVATDGFRSLVRTWGVGFCI